MLIGDRLVSRWDGMQQLARPAVHSNRLQGLTAQCCVLDWAIALHAAAMFITLSCCVLQTAYSKGHFAYT
jgi:hypothetical protein